MCAGSKDPFDIFVWSLKTGMLIDVLSGHTGPVSCLSFCHSNGMLASSSWDNTVRVWDVFGKNGMVENFTHSTEVLQVEFHPNSNDLITTSLNG